MAIDLDRCTGCEACVVACHAENNLPVSTPDQAAKGRTAHWIRVDRYYEGEFPDVKVKYMPVLCQQCDEAPCEPVCPTYATYHNPEGLERSGLQPLRRHVLLRQQLPLHGALLQLVRPGVARAAAVAAQSGCLHSPGRRDGKMHVLRAAHPARQGDAEAGKRPLADGEIQPACVQSCPAEAMVFGDLNDPESKVSRWPKAGARRVCSRNSAPSPKFFIWRGPK